MTYGHVSFNPYGAYLQVSYMLRCIDDVCGMMSRYENPRQFFASLSGKGQPVTSMFYGSRIDGESISRSTCAMGLISAISWVYYVS